MTISGVVLAAAVISLLLWAIGRGVTAAGDELLISLSAKAADAAGAAGDPLTPGIPGHRQPVLPGPGAALARERTVLRGYLSQDGAVMLADPVLGGNASCEPCITTVQQPARKTVPQDHSPTEDK
jgi:hypothetical protein